MAPRKWGTLSLLVVVAAVGLSLSACADAPVSITEVRGVAVADHLVEGARVSVISAAGETLALKEHATGSGGEFKVEVAGLPEKYTVVVTGGKSDGRPLDGDLKAMATSADATGVVHVTPVSSLAAEYAAAKPGLSSGEALAKVKAALGIPAATDTRSWMSSTEPHFDSSRYMVAAARAGGLDEHEAALVSRLDGAKAGSLTFSGSVADELVMEAVKGAAGTAGEALAGWVLRKAGLPDQSSNLDGVKRQLDELQSELKAMSQEIQQVHLALLTSEIQHRDETVRAGTMQVSECATVSVDQGTVATAIDNGKALRAQAEAQPFSAVLTDNNVTNQSGGGLLREYRKAQLAKAYWTQPDVDGIKGQFDYYRSLQLCEYLLIAEYLHATDGSAPSSDTASPGVASTIGGLGDLYIASRNLQKSKYSPPVNRLHPSVAYSTKGNLMVAYGMVARYDDAKWSVGKKGIPRDSKAKNPDWALGAFNKSGGGPAGYHDWRIPTKDEIKIIFSRSDYNGFYAKPSSQGSHLPKNAIIWTSEWKKGWAYDTGAKENFNYNQTYDPDSKPDMYDGISEPYSPGPASILFVRTVNQAKEGYWSTPLK